MNNYNNDNGSLFEEMLSDPDESFLFGGSDICHDPIEEQGFDEQLFGL